MFRRKYIFSSIMAITLIVIAAAVSISPQLNWRARVLFLKITGELADVSVSDLTVMAWPNSPYSLDRLADTRNPFAVIKNPLRSASDTKLGSDLFRNNCSTCHGDRGQGGIVAPSLQLPVFKHGRSDWAIYSTVRNGVPSTAMAPHDYPRDALWRIVAYIQSLEATHSAKNEIAKSDPASDFGVVKYQDIVVNEAAARDWLTYSGSYSGTRYSELKQISPRNINLLAPRWVFQFDSGNGLKIECTPLVHDGKMFLTGPSGTVVALDASTGEKLWSFERKPPATSLGWDGGSNRGVALLDDFVFVGTSDAKLIALSAATGKLAWETVVASPESKRHITAAPLAINGLVIVGTSGAFGRGYIAAYESRTGKERWRFYTIPKPTEPQGDTWAGDSGQKGGAAAWMTGSYDPVSDIIYWGTGNPAPDYNRLSRKGDNLYSNSVVALRGATGELLWHFQFTPGDDHDWDSAQVPVLANLHADAQGSAQLLVPNRNGFFYNINRDSGKPNLASSYVFQNWTKGLDSQWRPMATEHGKEGARGVLTYPSNVGGTNWWPSSFDSRLEYIFIPAIERGQIFFPGTAEYDPGPKNFPASSGQPHYTLIKAVNAKTGDEVWQHRFASRWDKEETAGLLSTASGLVFGGDLSSIFAFRSTNGEQLWQFSTGGQISAAPMTYSVGGKQFVVVAAGNAFFAFGLAEVQK